jgi:lipopolysaccharide/colanic/teichoic acid biosynthesis glycosyltransferase
LDELPQLLNVIKGEMSLVGPRPLPVSEAKKLTKNQKVRELIKPGITSSWVIKGTHNLSFKEWMRLDKQCVLKASLLGDIEILFKTLLIVLKLPIGRILDALGA